MKSTIYIQSHRKPDEVLYLVQSAIEREIAQLELALKLAKQRLVKFEEKYGVTSAHFMSEMAAEDLQGGDEEYVCWAGEYKLIQRLQDKLQTLQEISFGNTDLFREDQSDC